MVGMTSMFFHLLVTRKLPGRPLPMTMPRGGRTWQGAGGAGLDGVVRGRFNLIQVGGLIHTGGLGRLGCPEQGVGRADTWAACPVPWPQSPRPHGPIAHAHLRRHVLHRHERVLDDEACHLRGGPEIMETRRQG
jgi:hypothetical protein